MASRSDLSAHDAHLTAKTVRAAARGDRRAFERIYRATVGRIHSLARRLLGASDAEDGTQEVFVRLWGRLGSFRGEGAFEAWLGRFARNMLLDRLAAGRRRADLFGLSGLDQPDTQPAPTRQVVFELEDAIDLLPDGARAAFVLHDVEGHTHAEIAELLRVSVGTSKSQLHRARTLLRAALDPREGSTQRTKPR